MFVRLKTIKGKPYAYLVENEWTPWGSRQKVSKYLGKAFLLEQKHEEANELPEGFHNAVIEACAQNLTRHGFKRNGNKLMHEDIVVDLTEHKVVRKNKNVVLGMHEGYFCEDTLKQLLAYTAEERHEASAVKLAKLVLEAGLKLPEEQFVHLFQQVKTI